MRSQSQQPLLRLSDSSTFVCQVGMKKNKTKKQKQQQQPWEPPLLCWTLNAAVRTDVGHRGRQNKRGDDCQGAQGTSSFGLTQLQRRQRSEEERRDAQTLPSAGGERYALLFLAISCEWVQLIIMHLFIACVYYMFIVSVWSFGFCKALKQIKLYYYYYDYFYRTIIIYYSHLTLLLGLLAAQEKWKTPVKRCLPFTHFTLYPKFFYPDYSIHILINAICH